MRETWKVGEASGFTRQAPLVSVSSRGGTERKIGESGKAALEWPRHLAGEVGARVPCGLTRACSGGHGRVTPA